MADGLPKPEKRKGFTPRDVAAVFIKCDGRCAKCSQKVKLGEYAIDHIHRLDALGAHCLDNWQLLCTPCHAEKTRVDNREAKKGRRIRGELKPREKKQIPSRPFMSLDPRGAANFGGLKKLQGRGFDKRLGKRMNGQVYSKITGENS